LTDGTTDRAVLQVAGWGGIVATIVGFIVVIVLPTGMVAEASSENKGSVQANMAAFLSGFSHNNAPLAETLGLCVVAVALLPLSLALYRALKNDAFASAYLGGVLGVVFSVLLVTFLITRYETEAAAAYLYGNVGSSNQTALVTAANEAAFSTYGLFLVAFFFGAVSLIALGGAMFRSRYFGPPYGAITVAFGVLFAYVFISVGVTLPLASPGFLFGGLGILVWPLVVGQKLVRLARVRPADPITPASAAV
jgi:hypothetical protein